jgi:hypothetical protein
MSFCIKYEEEDRCFLFFQDLLCSKENPEKDPIGVNVDIPKYSILYEVGR